MKYKNLSIDIETLDTLPGGLIVSIGAVAFNRGGVCQDMFAVRLSIVDGMQLGFTVDPATLDWWANQSNIAFAALENGLTAVRVAAAFEQLAAYVRAHCDVEQVEVWTKGPSFDAGFLNVASARVKVPLPWKFYNERCVRTICAGVEMPKMRKSEVAHNALDDAIYQARCVMRALRAKDVSGKGAKG